MPLKSSYRVPTHLAHAVTACILACLSLSIIELLGSLKTSPGVPHESAYRQFIQLPTVALKVVDEPDRFGLYDDLDWASTSPLGHGFVKFDSDYHVVSMYHQIHCLNSLRQYFKAGTNVSISEHNAQHVEHCLSYLRQMMLCAADTTLEPAFSAVDEAGHATKAAYGGGVVHKCRDWVRAREFVEDNYRMWKSEAASVKHRR